MFELPFLRLVQSVFNGIVIASLLAVGVRYLVAASRGELEFTTPIRVHVGVLAGLLLLSIAFGYQLDKYELAYSTRGIATGVVLHRPERPVLRLRRPHGAVRACRRAARRRGVHPDAVAAGPDDRPVVRRVAAHRPAVSRGDPAADRPAEPVRAGGALHREQHRDDPDGVRAGRVGARGRSRARRGSTPPPSRRRRTRSGTPGCGTTDRWVPRSTSSSASVATTTSSTSTPTATTSRASSAR